MARGLSGVLKVRIKCLLGQALDTTVIAVGHPNITGHINSNTVGMVELSFSAALISDRTDDSTVERYDNKSA